MKGAVRVYLVRHGAVIPPKPGCIYGAMDVELSELGKREAHAAAAFLKDDSLDLVVHSPLKVAIESPSHTLKAFLPQL
jgi:broad specificity phosphatase PhoE